MLGGYNRSNFGWKSFGVLPLARRLIRRWNFLLRWEDERGIFVTDFVSDCKVMEHHGVINLTNRFHDLYIQSTWICYIPCHDERIVLLMLSEHPCVRYCPRELHERDCLIEQQRGTMTRTIDCLTIFSRCCGYGPFRDFVRENVDGLSSFPHESITMCARVQAYWIWKSRNLWGRIVNKRISCPKSHNEVWCIELFLVL